MSTPPADEHFPTRDRTPAQARSSTLERPGPTDAPLDSGHSSRSGHRHRRTVGVALAFVGLIAVMVGTFLPWLTSGGVNRDSYEITGIVTRLGFAGHGFGASALSCWPFLGPVAMLAVIVGILRWWRTHAAVALLFGLLTGVIGGGVMAVAGGHAAAGIELAYAGPTVTVVGAVLCVIGAAVILFPAGRRRSV